MSFRLLVRQFLLLSLVLPAGAAWAFNPPVDRAGPLVVRIGVPETITQIAPIRVEVVVENRGQAAVSGTLRLGLIDGWLSEPAGDVPFSVPAKPGGKTEVAPALIFTVTPSPQTYDNVHYPIHARARFLTGGVHYEAHPIAIVQTRLNRQPAAKPAIVEFKPLELANPGALGLRWDPVRRVVVQVFGEKPLVMPAGWQGSEPRSKASLSLRSVTLSGEARECIVMHPPWADGHVGTIVAEFPLRLPNALPLWLDFANAVQPTGNGDGVTFRVRAVAWDAPAGELGPVLYEHHSTARTWAAASADLSSLAGRSVRLQLESHPGPKNNTSFDESYWAEPVLAAGTPPGSRAFPLTDVAGSTLLGTVACGGKDYSVRIWRGVRGLLDAAIGFSDGQRLLAFQGFDIRALDSRLSDPRSALVLKRVDIEPVSSGVSMRHVFACPAGSFDLLGRLWLEGNVLRASFKLQNAPLPQPWQVTRLEDISLGPWSHTARQIYAGAGNVIRNPQKPFELGFDGHRLSTSFAGFDFAEGPSIVLGSDLPPAGLSVRPAERHYSLHMAHEATLSVILCANVWDGVKTWRHINGLRPAGGVREAAGRFVFDLWGGRYDKSTEDLQRAFRYGLTDAMVIWHNWQRWGYDYRLPDIMPPNPQFGTLEEVQRLAKTCREAGVLFGPHDNYIDFYPDADGFSYPAAIAFRASGEPVKAWYNEGRKAQSYRYRADQIEPFLRRNVAAVKEALAPTAYFIDVWSSALPYDYWTADGRFFPRTYTGEVWGRSFAWIRQQLGGRAPQISESGHDGLIGWLDGAQTNHLRVGEPIRGSRNWTVWNIACDDAERTPWFDAAHHDRFILHGAGYPGRYEGGLNPRDHGIYSDDYIATEVLTGHPAMVAQAFGPQIVRKYWLLHGLGRALALRSIERVEFDGGDLHRQHVTWSGAGEVWVNRGRTDWTVSGEVLPEYGFLAHIETSSGPVKAGLVRREGQIVEWSSAHGEMYVNGRLPSLDVRRIKVSVDKIEPRGPRQFEMALTWQADDPIPADWAPFFHFVDQRGEILFQAQHQPGRFEADRQGKFGGKLRFTVPEGVKPGQTIPLHFGFYQPGQGKRMMLVGPDDGSLRIRLGKVRLVGKAGQLTAAEWQPEQAPPDRTSERYNVARRPVAFPPFITTAGGCQLRRDAHGLTVIPLPQGAREKFAAEVRCDAFPGLGTPSHIELLSETGAVLSRGPAQQENGRVRIECPAEAWACRLVSAGE